MLSTYEQRSKLKLTATIMTVLVIAGIVLLADHIKAQKSPTSAVLQTSASTSSTLPLSTPATSSNSSTTVTTNSSTYKDGTYSANSSYYVPHGQEAIKVTLTVKNGIVTDSSVQNSQNDFTSAQYQQYFAAEYKSYVIGQKISGLQIGVIAGASDTTQGFNDAVSQIASQAQG